MVVARRRRVVPLTENAAERHRSSIAEMSADKISPADDQADAEIDSDKLADGGVRFDSGESAETSFRASE
jgi:hypothetical protein